VSEIDLAARRVPEMSWPVARMAVSLFCAAASIMVSSAFMDSLPTRLGEHALPGRSQSLGNRENALKQL
jgi:hypothetical protein